VCANSQTPMATRAPNKTFAFVARVALAPPQRHTHSHTGHTHSGTHALANNKHGYANTRVLDKIHDCEIRKRSCGIMRKFSSGFSSLLLFVANTSTAQRRMNAVRRTSDVLMAAQPAVAAHQTKVAKTVRGNINTTIRNNDFSIKIIFKKS